MEVAATREEAYEAMLVAWNKMQDSLGGPVDAEDVRQMRSLKEAFTQAANDYCAMAWTPERSVKEPAQSAAISQ